MLIGITDLSKHSFLSKITDNAYGKTGGYLLVELKSRTIIYATDKNRIMEVLPGPGFNPLIDRAIKGWEGSGITTRPSNGVEILSSVKGIPIAGWYAAAMMPTEEAFAPVHALQQRVLLATIFLTLLVGAMTFWMLKRQLEPVFTTIKILAALSDTDQHTQSLPIARQDEIGELIGGFNHLLETLAQRGEALRESEERFRKLAEAGWEGLVFHKDGVLIDANESFSKMFGYSSNEVIGKSVLVFLAPESVEVAAQKLKEYSLGDQSYFEAKGLRKDKTIISIELMGRPIRYKDINARVLALRDITDRKQAEEALRGSEEKHKRMIANISDIIAIMDIGGTLKYKSPNIEKWFGWQPGDLIGTDGWETVHPDDLERIQKEFFTLLDKDDSVGTVEYRYKCKDGSYKLIELTAVNLTSDPLINGVLMNYRDITDRKQAEDDLKKNQQLLVISQHLAHMGSWENELSTGKLSWSDEMYRILGFPDASPVYLDMALSVFPQDELIRFREAIASAIRGDAPYNIDYTIKRHDGQVRTIHDEGEVFFDEHGTAVRMFGITQDITAHKHAEEEKAKLEAQFLQAQKMESVGRLAGGVAHDFNNMLGVIIGYAEVAMDQVDPDQPLHANLEEIRNAANRSAGLTRQLLAFARKQVVSPKVLDTNETIEGMLKMLRRLIGEDINLAWLPGANTWPVKVDPSQIDQILANLCINARDAIAGVGKLTIETGNSNFDEDYCTDHVGFVPGEYALLTVSDDGCGMDKETIVKIFEPFFTTKEVGKGTGLGLATVYGIVKQNNGFINVYSEPDHGTTFRIYLPRHAGAVEEKRTEAGAVSLMRGKETILLVEDELVLLELNKFILERQGYRVLPAGTPGEAIRLAEEYTGDIHLLMTDVVMPEMNGLDLARKMLSQSPHLKCLFTSGYTADVIAHHGVLDAGVHFIQKPFSRKDLAAKVREALDQE